MTAKEQIAREAMKLEPAEREALAEQLLLSLTEADRDDIDAAWLAEAARRDAEFAAGRMTAAPVAQVINHLMAKARR